MTARTRSTPFQQERAQSIGAVGGRNAVDLPAQDDSEVIAVLDDAEGPEAVMAGFASPPAELRATVQRHGVLPPLTIDIER